MKSTFIQINRSEHNEYFLNDHNISYFSDGFFLYIFYENEEFHLQDDIKKSLFDLFESNNIKYSYYTDDCGHFDKLLEHKDESKIMLTVEVLIEYLKKQNPKALVLGYEPNSFAYTSQIRELPNFCIQTVSESKKRDREYYTKYFEKDPNITTKEGLEKKVQEQIEELYRFSHNDDVIISF